MIEVIREVRNEAMKQYGYLMGGTMVHTDDPANVPVIAGKTLMIGKPGISQKPE
jgi:hypothetical protein